MSRIEHSLIAAAADLLPIGVILLDPDGLILWENQAMGAILGLPPGIQSPAIGQKLQDLPNIRSAKLGPVIGELLRGRLIERLVVDFVTIASRRTTVEISGGPLDHEDGSRLGSWISVRDLPSAASLSGRLLAAQRMEFVGVAVTGVIHDLNNLMTALGGTLDLLRGGHNADPSLLEALESMLRRSRDITRQLLQTASSDSADFAPIDLLTPVRQAADLFHYSFGSDVVVHTALPDFQIPVLGSRTRLLQLLFNLGLNARDAMKGRGDIHIELSTPKDALVCERQGWPGSRYVQLLFWDTGPGVDCESRARLFEPFYSTKGPDQGTGMGLSVVQRTVLDHRGTIEIVERDEAGACFLIRLPRHDEPVEDDERTVIAPSPLQRADNARPLDGMRILVADDEETIRLTLSSLLGAAGASVVQAANGRQAIHLISASADEPEPLDAALVDLQMPGAAGIDVIAHARRTLPEVLLVATSGLEPEGAVRDLLADHGAAFLGKPFRIANIIEALV